MPNPKYLLLSDTTLTHSYKNFPLLDYLPSAPSYLPWPIYYFLKGRAPPPLPDGQATLAPYSVRKIEASLLREIPAEDIAVPHEDHLERFITHDTEVIAVSTMDPLGLGPLTLAFALLFGSKNYTAWVRKEFEELMARIDRAKSRVGSNAKVLVGGPGVWEFTIMPGELERMGIDYAFQGEADDIAPELFEEVANGSLRYDRGSFFPGFQSFDPDFRRSWVEHSGFVTRARFSKQAPTLDEIPEIRKPTMKSIVEVMRGCGVGCDFCEVTLRPLRYYPYDKIKREVEVNAKLGGFTSVWFHSDEVFSYQHGKNFEPNSEALTALFSAIMSVKGIVQSNPTHGRISIPAAYPDLMRGLSRIAKAGASNWIGIQVGIETGSERLAKLHMPNKTLPLKPGSDGSWQEIVWQGVYTMNKYYWRPAFTVQVGQTGETPEDNWETVALINWLSNSRLDSGRPFEFTVTPMQSVPLGKLRSGCLTSAIMDESQLAVYYVSYRHLARMAGRDAMKESKGNTLSRYGTSALMLLGSKAMLRTVSAICKKGGLDLEKAASYGCDQKIAQVPMLQTI